MDETIQQLLEAKDTIISKQQEAITLLEQLAEARRVAFVNQCKELAEHRQFDNSHKHPWLFFWFCLLRNVWPFSLWYGRFQ